MDPAHHENPTKTGPKPAHISIDPARDAAFSFLAQQATRFPSLDLAPLDSSALTARDAAFAHAITDAVIRRWLTLQHIVQARLQQPFPSLQPQLRAALLAGTAQVLLLDRVPAYAAIDHAVEWAKRHIRLGAGGMVNAVLRRVAELRVECEPANRKPYEGGRAQIPLPDGTAVDLREPVLPEDELDLLAAATSHPRQQIDTWRESFKPEQARALAMHSLAHAPTILRCSSLTDLHLDPGLLQPHAQPGFAVFNGNHDTLVTLLDSRPDIWVQDPSSAAAIESVADLTPSLIIDACAGQGTKTRQLAATFPQAKIIATDVDTKRRQTLAAVFKGHPRVTVTTSDQLLQWAGQADLILLDVPCSNTGVLARRPEAKYRFNRRSIQELTDLQRQIIADAIPLMRERTGTSPGGLILYSTCSLEPAENGAHVAWAAQWHRFKPSRERVMLPRGGPGQPAAEYTDGSYSVVLAREEI